MLLPLVGLHLLKIIGADFFEFHFGEAHLDFMRILDVEEADADLGRIRWRRPEVEELAILLQIEHLLNGELEYGWKETIENDSRYQNHSTKYPKISGFVQTASDSNRRGIFSPKRRWPLHTHDRMQQI